MPWANRHATEDWQAHLTHRQFDRVPTRTGKAAEAVWHVDTEPATLARPIE